MADILQTTFSKIILLGFPEERQRCTDCRFIYFDCKTHISAFVSLHIGNEMLHCRSTLIPFCKSVYLPSVIFCLTLTSPFCYIICMFGLLLSHELCRILWWNWVNIVVSLMAIISLITHIRSTSSGLGAWMNKSVHMMYINVYVYTYIWCI